MKSTIEHSPEQEVQQVADFLFYKRRTGFAFDYSPEIAKGRLVLLEEYPSMNINIRQWTSI